MGKSLSMESSQNVFHNFSLRKMILSVQQERFFCLNGRLTLTNLMRLMSTLAISIFKLTIKNKCCMDRGSYLFSPSRKIYIKRGNIVRNIINVLEIQTKNLDKKDSGQSSQKRQSCQWSHWTLEVLPEKAISALRVRTPSVLYPPYLPCLAQNSHSLSRSGGGGLWRRLCSVLEWALPTFPFHGSILLRIHGWPPKPHSFNSPGSSLR